MSRQCDKCGGSGYVILTRYGMPILSRNETEFEQGRCPKCIDGEPLDALQILTRDRDEWKRRAEKAEKALANDYHCAECGARGKWRGAKRGAGVIAVCMDCALKEMTEMRNSALSQVEGLEAERDHYRAAMNVQLARAEEAESRAEQLSVELTNEELRHASWAELSNLQDANDRLLKRAEEAEREIVELKEAIEPCGVCFERDDASMDATVVPCMLVPIAKKRRAKR